MLGSRVVRMRRLAPVLLGGMGVAALAGCGDMGLGGLFGPIETRTFWVEAQGIVVAAEDGRPVAGATVQEYSGFGFLMGSATRTDAAGRYALELPLECTVQGRCWTSITLIAHLDGFGGGLAPRVETASPPHFSDGVDRVTVSMDFALRATRPITLVVEGRVARASGGTPVEGTKVAVDWAYHRAFVVPKSSTTTDAEGRYRLTSEHLCTIEGTACSASFAIGAEHEDERGYRWFNDVAVTGDSLQLRVDFLDF